MKIKRLLLFLFILFSILIPSSAFAANQFNNARDIVLGRDETLDKDFFAAGNNITISGTVNGDTYLAGGNVLVEGTINGDLITAGGIVNIRGTVNGNVRAVGGNITITGPVTHNASIAGGNIDLTDSANVGNNLIIAGGNVIVLAPIAKDISAVCGQLNIGNTVGGDVNTRVGQMTLNPSANIAGNLNYWSNNKANIQPGAVVAGSTTQYFPPQQQAPGKNIVNTLVGLAAAFKIISLISLFILGSLFWFVMPNYTQRTINTANQEPWLSLGIGILAAILIPILVFILLILIFTLPLALLLLGIFLINWYIAKIFIIIWIGQKILSLFNNPDATYLALLIGLIVYGLVTLIPILGGLIGLIVTLIGLGAIILEEQSFYKDLRSKKFI